MENLFSESRKNELLEKFKALKTVKQKLAFWENELQLDYLICLENGLNELYDFYINTDEGEQRQYLNKWYLENIPKAFPYIKYLDLKALKKDLNKRLNLTKNKLSVLIEERKKIDGSFYQRSSRHTIAKDGDYFNDLYAAGKDSFDDSFLYNEEPDYSIALAGINIYRVQNGYILGQYRRYVQQEIDDLKVPKQRKGSEDLTVHQKVLLLHLIGVLDKVESIDTSDKAKVLAPLMGIGLKSFYDAALNVRSKEIKNKENILELLDYLKEKEIKSFQNKLKGELEKVS